MEESEWMFSPDSNSFDDVYTREEAGQVVDYLSKNEVAFQQQLEAAGKSYDEIQAIVKQVWLNLLRACKRTGYTDDVVKVTAQQYGFKM